MHRASIPYAERIRDAWRYPLTRSGAMVMVTAGFVFAYCVSVISLTPLVIALFYASFLGLTMQTATSASEELEPPDFTKAGDVLLPALKGIVASSLLFAPAVAYLHYGREWMLDGIFADPVIWLLGAFGLAYVPMALLVAAGGNGLLTILNPLAVIGYAVDLGKDYLVCAAVLWPLAIIQLELATIFATSGLLAGNFLLAWPAWSALLYVPFVIARVLGMLLYTRGDAVGFGTPADYEVRISQETPRGVRKEAAARDYLGEERGAETEVAATGTSSAAAVQHVARHAPIELEPDPVPATQPPIQPVRPRLESLDPSTLPPLRKPTKAED